jgi:4'-phosphopantetheinyl transferase
MVGGSPGSLDGLAVWAARLSDVQPHWIALLDAAERERYDRLRWRTDRARLLLGACLVRAVVGARLGVAPTRITLDRTCSQCGQPHGRVRVIGGDVAVSVSHSGDWVLVAERVGGPVGVDVELIDPSVNTSALARVVLRPAEHSTLTRLRWDDRPAAFARYWTRKEAVLKVTGDGLRVPLRDLHMSAPDQRAALISWSRRPELVRRLRLADVVVAQGFAACVAIHVASEAEDGPPSPLSASPAGSVLARLDDGCAV